MSQQDEHEEHSAIGGQHGEEIARDNVFDMIGQKGPPRGGRWLADTRAVLLDGRFCHGDPSLLSSPTMRGEPHVGLLHHMSRINSRTSFEMGGRPGLPLRLNRRQ